MVESGYDLRSTVGALGGAAEHAGLGPREIQRTIRSAYRRTIPQPDAGAQHRASSPGVAL